MEELLALNEAPDRFAAKDPVKAELVKLRYFAGLSEEEAAVALGISRDTASRYWTYARAWLINELIERVKKRTKDGRRFLVGTSYGGGVIPKENVVRASDYLLLHGNGVKDPARIAEMVRQTRKVLGYRAMPILFNEDDHFDFDQPKNNSVAAIGEYASWGFFDFRMKGEGFDDGYQSVPVNWGAMSPRKQGFFRLLSEITVEGRGAREEGRVFPGKTWSTKTPQQVGLDAKTLDAFRDLVGGRGAIVLARHFAHTVAPIFNRGLALPFFAGGYSQARTWSLTFCNRSSLIFSG